jgi:hypothetical protein
MATRGAAASALAPKSNAVMIFVFIFVSSNFRTR